MSSIAKPARRQYDADDNADMVTVAGGVAVAVAQEKDKRSADHENLLTKKDGPMSECQNVDCVRDRSAKWDREHHPNAIRAATWTELVVMGFFTVYAWMAAFELGNIVVTNETAYVWFNWGITAFFFVWVFAGWRAAYKNAQVERVAQQDKVRHELPYPSMNKYTESWIISRFLLWAALSSTEHVFYSNYNKLYPQQQMWNLIHLFWLKIVLVILSTYPFYRGWWTWVKNGIRNRCCGAHCLDF